MKAEFKTYKELEDFVLPLIREKKWAVHVSGDESKGYKVQWIERKEYTTYDGKVFPDEVWITEKGEMLCVQDLEAEHAKNIIRMILRTRREKLNYLQNLLDYMEDLDENNLQGIDSNSSSTLH